MMPLRSKRACSAQRRHAALSMSGPEGAPGICFPGAAVAASLQPGATEGGTGWDDFELLLLRAPLA